MIFVIITTSILLVLGFTTITISQDNFKMKNVNSISKKNFYIAEALSEEADMKLHEYLKKSLDISYEKLLNYISESDEINGTDIVLINEKFQEFYKEQVYLMKRELEITDNYNLKIIEKYEFLIKVNIEDNLETDGFNMHILAIFEDENIVEKIQTQYTIDLPKYNDHDHNRSLLKRAGWVNFKW